MGTEAWSSEAKLVFNTKQSSFFHLLFLIEISSKVKFGGLPNLQEFCFSKLSILGPFPFKKIGLIEEELNSKSVLTTSVGFWVFLRLP